MICFFLYLHVQPKFLHTTMFRVCFLLSFDKMCICKCSPEWSDHGITMKVDDSAIEVLAVWLGQALASQSWKNGVYLDPWESLGLDMGLMPHGSRLCTLCTFWCGSSKAGISMESIAVLIVILSCRIIPNITNIYQYYRVSDVGLEYYLWSSRFSQFSCKLRVSCPPSQLGAPC